MLLPRQDPIAGGLFPLFARMDCHGLMKDGSFLIHTGQNFTQGLLVATNPSIAHSKCQYCVGIIHFERQYFHQ